MQTLKVHRETLPNGLTVLVVPSSRIPQVSVQLWYHVGSKNEQSGQKGIAHLIEHMIFKGTERLSESDINQITQKLGGDCNAFTSHDYTGYLFDFPTQNWHEALPIMADCMHNCTFREEFLRSELKAVVQELKMYRDDYISTVLERMMSTMFADHPYRYPVIGYKQDLWSLHRETLVSFYRKHYIPNNATLVIVGDVTIDDAMRRAQHAFSGIPAHEEYVQPPLYHASSLESTSTTLFCDIQQPQGVVAWEIPGIVARKDYLVDISSWLLSAGKGSRLYQRIVEELQLANDIDAFTYDLFEHGLFVINFEPAEGVDSAQVAAAIRHEIAEVAAHGFTQRELERAQRKTMVDWVGLREQNQKYAYLVGKYFTALRDENYCAQYLEQVAQDNVADAVHDLIATYLRPAIAHEGFIEPVAPSEKVYWLQQQERSDAEDKRILSSIVRETEVEPGMYVHQVHCAPAKNFDFPQPQRFTLPNGLTVLYHHDPLLPTVDMVLELKFRHYYDPEDKQGLAMLLADAIQEGTTQRSSVEFAHEVEGYGMSLNVVPGFVSLKALSSDIERGLDLMLDMLQNATLSESVCDRVRDRLLADVRVFWDTPNKCAAQLMRQIVYRNHPYHRATLGTAESLARITPDDVVHAKKAWLTPHDAAIALVGNLEGCDLEALLKKTLGLWEGPQLSTPLFPELTLEMPAQRVRHYVQRDQVVLAFGRPSISRLHPQYDPLLVWDQIFTGSLGGAMSSRLFALRERSGLFYTVGGSLLAGAGKQPGMAYVATAVSNDRLQEAEDAIRACIDRGTQGVTDEEITEAHCALTTSIIDLFATNRQTAASFLFLHEYNLPATYFAQRSQQLAAVTRNDIITAAADLMHADTFATVLVGRV